MKKFALVAGVSLFFTSIGGTSQSASPSSANPLFGFRNSAEENAIEARFLAVPDPKLAETHLRTLTQAPHMAGTPEDKGTAADVAQKIPEEGPGNENVGVK